MVKFVYFGLLTIALAACCHDDERVVILNADYFPLQEGNYWIYEPFLPHAGSMPRREIRVTDTEELGGRSYFKLIARDVNGEYQDTLFYRVDTNGYVLSRHRNTTEEVVYHLKAAKGESWHSYSDGIMTFNDFMPVTFTDDVTLTNCRAYSFDIADVADEEWGSILAPGIGLIQTESYAWGGGLKIVEAKINGVVIKFQ